MKTVIVTGDSGGLGSAIVSDLLQAAEYNVIGISRRKNEAVAAFTEKYPSQYTHINYDLTNSEDIKMLFINILKKHGPFYGLVNNSAHAYDDIVTNAKVRDLEWMFRVNVLSPIILTKYIIRDFILNRTPGSIVHISSVSAHTGYKGLSMYAATKGAMESFSKGVAREWGAKGIRSNCIAPGFMETNISKNLTIEQKDRIYKRTSLGNATNIESVASTVKFLLSSDACSITGAVISVDNGTI